LGGEKSRKEKRKKERKNNINRKIIMIEKLKRNGKERDS